MSVQNSEFFFNSAGGFYPHKIDGSLRFNDDDSAYLNRTPASAGNRRTWTWSGWVKRASRLGGQNHILLSKRTAATSRTTFRISSDKLDIIDGDINFRLQTTAVFRDPSSWYHIILAVDTTQATSSNRIKMYVNGDQVTAFSTSTYPSLNFETQINTTNPHYLGTETFPVNDLFDGYMAEINFIDGQALSPSSFGETKSGVWVPKKYAGTYGTNGFYLKFAGNANDSSGNGNNWTANTISSYDYVPDSPTNNFCTINPLDGLSSPTLSQGNLRYYPNVSGVRRSTLGFKDQKLYFEICQESSVTNYTPFVYGICELEGAPTHVAYKQGIAIYNDNGTGHSFWVYVNGSLVQDNAGYFTTTSAGDVWMVAYDGQTGKCWIGRNGTWFNSGNPAAGTGFIYQFSGDYTMAPVMGHAGANYTAVLNAGQDSSFAGNKTAQGNSDGNGIGDFYYTPPSGFLALCTANLPEPAISPADDESPGDYFNTVLYTGNGGTNSVTGVGFQPDWVWIKSRSQSEGHRLFDVVRGVQKMLFTNGTGAELTSSLTSFNSDGFTLTGNIYSENNSGSSLVAWNWKAGGTGVSNTAGSVTSTVSASTEAGFSICTFTAPVSGTCTVGHGLGVAPECFFIKSRANAYGWTFYHKDIGSNKYLNLNSTAAPATDTNTWNNTAPTSSVFTLGPNFQNTSTWVGYCFAGVEGYSKFGSYTGNNNADGPFVYTGFRPKFWMSKRTDSTSSWLIVDGERNTYNVVDDYLLTNTSASENSATVVDFLSNGVKFRGTTHNESGATFIYMAFAENPFKYANAR